MKTYQVNDNLTVGLRCWLQPSISAVRFCVRYRVLPMDRALAVADWLIERGVVVRVGSGV